MLIHVIGSMRGVFGMLLCIIGCDTRLGNWDAPPSNWDAPGCIWNTPSSN